MAHKPPKRLSVTFLFDTENPWLEPFILEEWKNLDHQKFTFDLSHDRSSVNSRDIVFVLGYTKILPKDFLQANGLCLVVHESNLPKGRGFSPVQAQILAGQNTIPICLFAATEEPDAGDVYELDNFHLTGYELFPAIREKQAKATLNLIHRFLVRFPHVSGTPQTGEESFFPKRCTEDNELDVDKTIRDQFARLRLGNNDGWPSHFSIDGHKYLVKIYESPTD